MCGSVSGPTDALLFTDTAGSRISSTRFWTTTWTSALDAACHLVRVDGKPDLDAPRLTTRPRVRDLRLTHASRMIAAGMDLFVLQRRLGHESITTTTETYAHLVPDQQRAAADAAGRAMAGLASPGGTAVDLAGRAGAGQVRVGQHAPRWQLETWQPRPGTRQTVCEK